MTQWLKRRLRPGDTYIDVGANVGYFSLLAAQLVGEKGRVVAIEASPTFHARILRHAELNDCHHLRAVNAAVADERKTVTLILASSNNMGAASIVPYGAPLRTSARSRHARSPTFSIRPTSRPPG